LIHFYKRLIKMRRHLYTCVAVLAALSFRQVKGHGRLMDPPARNCMWRFGYLNPINYNDNEVFCGGVKKQFKENDGKCGVCGDPWDAPHPQLHETGGKFGNQVIAKTYVAGSFIDLEVELTANHKGRFQFKLCPVGPSEEATQACLDKHIIRTPQGSDGFTIQEKALKVQLTLKGKLPDKITCKRCVLQWTWRSANSWGKCANGTGALGCGAQETFRNCADIRIVGSSKLLPNTDNPRAIFIASESGRGRQPLVVRSQVCIATEAYARYHRMSDWCQVNCLNYPQNCPQSICVCLDECRALPGFNVTDFQCNRNCLRYPHTEECPDGCACTGAKTSNSDDFVILENNIETKGITLRRNLDNSLLPYAVSPFVRHAVLGTNEPELRRKLDNSLLPYAVSPFVRHAVLFNLPFLPYHSPFNV